MDLWKALIRFRVTIDMDSELANSYIEWLYWYTISRAPDFEKLGQLIIGSIPMSAES